MKPQKAKWIPISILMLELFLTNYSIGQTYNKINERTKQFIDSTYNNLIKKYEVIGASIAIVDDGEIVYATGYGFSDKEHKIKANEKTVFRIGSCTKSFTALSIMQLHEKKQLNINSSIKKHLTDLHITSRFNDNNQIYIKDILCHSSGLPCDIANGFFCDAPPNISWVISELNKQTTISPRLYIKAYSNVGYGLLGELIARTNNTSYSNYVKEHIFKPLNMTSSYIEKDTILSINLSKAYLNNKEIKEPLVRDQGAGLIHSNAIDMANYIKMYLNNGSFNGKAIISEQSVNEMKKNRMDSVLLSSESNWGYGLYTKKALVTKNKDSMIVNIIGHGGDTYAFHADFGFIPELKIGVVVLTNTDNGTKVNSAAKLLKRYIEVSKSKTLTLNYTEPDNSKDILNAKEQVCSENEIIGSYNFGEFMINIKNTHKIKFKQGPATIKLIQKKSNPQAYSIKAILYNVIPFKLKGIEASFVKLNNIIYFKQVDMKSNSGLYAATKSNSIAIPDSWKSKYGKYKINNNYYNCKKCPYGDVEGMSLSVKEEQGFIVIKTKGKTPDVNKTLFIDILSNEIGVTGGIGRGTGETIRLLPNGNIYYSGFEFQKIK